MTNPNKTILYYSNSVTIHDLKFIRVLTTLSPKVLVVTRKEISQHPKLPDGAQVISLSSINLAAHRHRVIIEQLYEIFRKHRPSLTIAGPLWPCAYEAARANAPKLVATSWAFDILVDAQKSIKKRRCIGNVLKNAELLLFDNPWILEKAKEIADLNVSRSSVFPWGVDTDLFSPAQERISLSKNPFLIFHNRTLDKIYRPSLLLSAFKIATREKANFRLRLVATGPLAQKTRQLARRLELDDKIDWIPPVNNRQLPALLHEASLYTSASYSDGTSISLLEAMACGLPVVVPALPSNAYLLAPAHRSQTYDIDCPTSMAKKWIEVSEMSDKSLEELGSMNRLKVVTYASMESFVKNYSSSIGELLNEN